MLVVCIACASGSEHWKVSIYGSDIGGIPDKLMMVV